MSQREGVYKEDDGNHEEADESKQNTSSKKFIDMKENFLTGDGSSKWAQVANLAKSVEESETTWTKAEIPDDIVKLSLFMLVNQAYFKQ